jgi:hypothetical protein
MVHGADISRIEQEGGETLRSGGRASGRQQLEDRAAAEDIEIG